MARRIDTHLTQSGSEVQDILNWAHCSFPYPPSEVTSPIEGDICVVTEGYHKISIRPAEGATSFAFTVASKRVKWEVSEDYDLSDGTIASLTCQSSASEQTTHIIPSPSSRTGEVTAFSDAFTLQWVSDKAADLKYITLYGYYEAGVFEYVNGAWVERTDLAQTLEKAKSAYQKPATGIPASDIADGVIPDVSQFITKMVDDLVNYYTKSQTYTKEEVQQIVSSLSTGAFIPVAVLPTASADTLGLKIYLVPSAEPQAQNIKDEFITIRSGSEGAYTYSWEQIGSTAIDLSDYVTETALETALEDYATKDELPQTLVCGAHVIPQPYSETKDVAETAALFGITEDQVRDLFTGKYKYIQFDGVILTVTVTNNDSSWCVKFQDPFDMTEYTLWGMTVAVGFLMLIGTRLQKDSAVLYTPQNLSDANKLQARTNIGATAPEVFWATYGTTTASEIDTAVSAGKQVFLSDGGWIYTYAGKDGNYHYFFAITGNISYRRIQLQISTNGWARHDIGVQGTAQKVNTIIGNETSTTNYPSAKAVYDAIVAGMENFIEGEDYSGVAPVLVDPSNYYTKAETEELVETPVAATQPSGGFLPNVIYDLGELTGSVTFALATPASNAVANPYQWTFETGSTAPTITWPTGLTWLGGNAPTINADKHYEIIVRNGYANCLEF